MFESLQEYYKYLENDNSLLYDFRLEKEIEFLKEKVKNDDSIFYCSCELYFLHFESKYEEINSAIFLSKEKKNINLTLTQYELEYIKSRAENINNYKYRAKYNHFIWCSNRHNIYGQRAIDNYLLLLKSDSFQIDDILSNRAFGNYFEKLFILCQTINYKKEEVVEYLISLLGLQKINIYIECSLIKYIIEQGQKISISNIQSFFDYCNKIIENSNNSDYINDYLKLLVSLSQRLELPLQPYQNKLGDFFISQSEKQNESMFKYDLYLKALEYYQKAGNKEKVEEVSILIEKIKPFIDLKLFQWEYTNEELQKLWEVIVKNTDELTEKDESKDIYEYIIHAQNIFPQAEILNENIRPMMYNFINVMSFDINKNVNNNQKIGFNIYALYIQNFSIKHLWMIFLKGIKNGKISFESLTHYFKNCSWYGQDFTFLNSDGGIEGFDWIELLSPSLSNFFNQLEINIKLNKDSSQDYILCIDSLTIKFEGLLREFSSNIGAKPIEYRNGSTTARVDFDKLLENEKLNEIIPKDDIALLKFLFTSEGINVRNNVAHCFYKTKNYSLDKMLLLIAALLKLGNYKLISKK